MRIRACLSKKLFFLGNFFSLLPWTWLLNLSIYERCKGKQSCIEKSCLACAIYFPSQQSQSLTDSLMFKGIPIPFIYAIIFQRTVLLSRLSGPNAVFLKKREITKEQGYNLFGSDKQRNIVLFFIIHSLFFFQLQLHALSL